MISKNEVIPNDTIVEWYCTTDMKWCLGQIMYHIDMYEVMGMDNITLYQPRYKYKIQDGSWMGAKVMIRGDAIREPITIKSHIDKMSDL